MRLCTVAFWGFINVSLTETLCYPEAYASRGRYVNSKMRSVRIPAISTRTGRSAANSSPTVLFQYPEQKGLEEDSAPDDGLIEQGVTVVVEQFVELVLGLHPVHQGML